MRQFVYYGARVEECGDSGHCGGVAFADAKKERIQFFLDKTGEEEKKNDLENNNYRREHH